MRPNKYSFGIGGVLSVIIVLFIYLYSAKQVGFGWGVLKWISLIYLIVVGGLLLLSIVIVAIIYLVIILFFLYAKWTARRAAKQGKTKTKDGKDAIDAEYEVKE